MPNFILRAKTKSDSFHIFHLTDIPLYLNNKECILANVMNSPILLGDTIHIGDEESGLCVGDIVEKNGDHFLICYERGFYAINENYVRCYLQDLNKENVIGNYFTDSFPVTMQHRKHIRFKYKDIIFTIHDIIGKSDDNLLIRLSKECIPPEQCQFDVGIHYKHKRIYLDDKLEDGCVQMQGGRIYLVKQDQLLDLDGKDKT